MGALWCSGSDSRLVIRGSAVRIPLGAYALRQGILSIIVSLDPGVVNGYRQEFIPCLPCAPNRQPGIAGVIIYICL